ncbi:MAG: YdjY domain-containing protein [Planctomycetales bacterium]
MRHPSRFAFRAGLSAIATVALTIFACARAQDDSDAKSTDATAAAKSTDAKPDDVGQGLQRLSEKHDIWIDLKNKEVVLKGEICRRQCQLEMLVTLKGGKEHESVVAVNTLAKYAHAALLALGARQGKPVQFRPKYQPPTGTEIEVLFRWVDSEGKTQEVRGQEWVRYTRTQRAMDLPFVFAGSEIYKDETTGETRYRAEDGDLICVSNFPTAMCDVPAKSSQGASDLLFEAFSERIPPVKTPITMILRPLLDKKPHVREPPKPAPQKSPGKSKGK